MHVKYFAAVLVVIMLSLPGAASAQSSAQGSDTPNSKSHLEYQGNSVNQGDVKAPTNDPYEQGRRSVREGLKRALQQNRSGQDSAVKDPDTDNAHKSYKAPLTLFEQAKKLVDPDGKMYPDERYIKAFGTVYRHYWDEGDPEKAKSTAASMIYYYRMESYRYLALAEAAAANGNLDSGAVQAYTKIPNGRDLKINKVDGGYEINVTDADGNRITKKVMDPKIYAAEAMRLNPATFDEEILNAAGVVSASGAAYACRGESAVGWQAAADEYGRPTALQPESYFAIRIDDERLSAERFGSSLPCVAQDQITCTGDGVVFHFNKNDNRYVLVMGNKANDRIPDPVSIELGRCSWLAN